MFVCVSIHLTRGGVRALLAPASPKHCLLRRILVCHYVGRRCQTRARAIFTRHNKCCRAMNDCINRAIDCNWRKVSSGLECVGVCLFLSDLKTHLQWMQLATPCWQCHRQMTVMTRLCRKMPALQCRTNNYTFSQAS